MNDCKVQDLMVRSVITVAPSDPLSTAARRLAARHISAAPVVDEDGTVVGILSESDILKALVPHSAADPPSILDLLSGATREAHEGPALVRDAMTTAVRCIPPGESIWQAANLMQQGQVKRLPVTADGKRLVGIISRADLIRAMARNDESILADILHALEALGEESRGIDVEVDTGMVTLRGVAPDATVIRAAGELAGRIPGVGGATNLVEREVIEEESATGDRG
ncbi:MAG: CBS domain-containing protein [Actinomycetota bacterium]